MIEIPSLTTERLLLRPFRDEDLDEYAAICADPEVMLYLGGNPLSRADAWRQMALFLGHWHLRGYGFWAVEERRSGAMIGRIGCWRPEGWPGLEVGWTLGREWWGKGYATEGARAVLDFAFTNLGREHVISLIHPDNRASIRVAERLGEGIEGETEIFGTRVLIYGVHRPAPGFSQS
jgi:RimJ/RimL family protein N-acetyltransferase